MLQRLNSQEKRSLIRNSCHSSNSSLGSLDNEIPSLQINISNMLFNGIAENEVLRLWLAELNFQEYFEKFLSAGYDLPTITRMTPEDLNAVGITNPVHRKRLKFEISRMNISDGLPNYIPVSLEEWLRILRLEEYEMLLKLQNYTTIGQITQISWEDLEDIGIKKLGHQKKVMLAIKRVKDIMEGKKVTSCAIIGMSNFRKTTTRCDPQCNSESCLSFEKNSCTRKCDVKPNDHLSSWQINSQNQKLFFNVNQFSSDACDTVKNSIIKNENGTLPLIRYCPDIVTLTSSRSNHTNISHEPIYEICQTFQCKGNPTNQKKIKKNCTPHRSLDDGDIIHDNKDRILYDGGGKTLPRLGNSAPKYRPVAKVSAKLRNNEHQPFKHPRKDSNLNVLPRDLINNSIVYSTFRSHVNPQKSNPPPLPQRSNSLCEQSTFSSKETYSDTKPPKETAQNLIHGDESNKSKISSNIPLAPSSPIFRNVNSEHPRYEFPPLPPPPLLSYTTSVNPKNYNPFINNENFREDELDTVNERKQRVNFSNSPCNFDSGRSLAFGNDKASIKNGHDQGNRPSLHFTVGFNNSANHSDFSVSSNICEERRQNEIQDYKETLLNSSRMKSFGHSEEKSDVFNDIGNMLTNLTDELDAMMIKQ